jgi:hypothetical protein
MKLSQTALQKWCFALCTLLAVAEAGAFDFSSFTKSGNEAPLRQGYTCCNLHYEGDWISDANWGAQPFIPAGTPAKITSFGRYRIHVELDGKRMRIGQDYGREQETLEKFAEKMVVLEDPKPRIAKYPADVREAIRLGQVMEGMTREQAIVAVGYPQTDQTVSLDAPVWNHWVSSFGPYQLIWDKNGRIKEITTDPQTHHLMVYRKGR